MFQVILVYVILAAFVVKLYGVFFLCLTYLIYEIYVEHKHINQNKKKRQTNR